MSTFHFSSTPSSLRCSIVDKENLIDLFLGGFVALLERIDVEPNAWNLHSAASVGNIPPSLSAKLMFT